MFTAHALTKLATKGIHAALLDALLDTRPALPIRARLRLSDADRAPIVAHSLATVRVCELSWVWSTSISSLASKLLDMLDAGGHDGVGLAAARLALEKLRQLAPASFEAEITRYADEIDLSLVRWIAYAERVHTGSADGRRTSTSQLSSDPRNMLEPDHALDAAIILYLLAPLAPLHTTRVPLHRLADMLEFSGDAFDPTIASLRKAADAVLCNELPIRSGFDAAHKRGQSAA